MKHRTVWLSDTHLGTRGCNAAQLLHFLIENDADTIYLVGDIVDGWSLRRKIYWPQSHNDVVRMLLQKAVTTRIVWVVGNHDQFLKSYIGNSFGGIEIVDEIVHTTADGRKLLTLHGDKFDVITKYHSWLAKLGDISYDALLMVNRWLMLIRCWMGFKYWSLSAYIKHRVKQAAAFISHYEQTIAMECRHRGFHGIVCGHIHHAEIRWIDDVLYCNDGDFVESCTALVEDFDGNLTILRMV
jgi:UDP-2,3-diacylglucosamine pyrophosphatase LpxH